MLIRFLDYVRTKNPAVRQRYALGLAGSITGVIALVWITALPARFMSAEENTAAVPLAPFASLWTEVREQFGGVRDAAMQLGALATTTATTTATSTFDALTLIPESARVGDLEQIPVAVLIATSSQMTATTTATTSATTSARVGE